MDRWASSPVMATAYIGICCNASCLIQPSPVSYLEMFPGPRKAKPTANKHCVLHLPSSAIRPTLLICCLSVCLSILFIICICAHVSGCAIAHTRRSEFNSMEQLSPSTFIWGTLKSPGLSRKLLYPLSHLAGPWVCVVTVKPADSMIPQLLST